MDASGGDIFGKMKRGGFLIGIWTVVGAVVLALGWIRLAPSDVGRWHVAQEISADYDLNGGVVRRLEGLGADGLGRLDAVIRAEPRTEVLAGSVAEGMITYVTRSMVMGFPDYTTVQQGGDDLTIRARLRFGRSDFGVNRRRVGRWIVALGAE